MRKILELVIKSGARVAEPGEFTKRAFLNGRIDLTKAEGVMNLINSETELTRRMAINEVSGKVSKLITDLRDESNREGIRVVIELRKDVVAEVVLNQLFKHTQMQDTFGVIMLALVNGEPKILTLKDCLEEYVKHRREVILRRTKFDLEKAEARAHILEGLLKAIDNIDEVIQIIRSSYDDAKERLMERFGFSGIQAQACFMSVSSLSAGCPNSRKSALVATFSKKMSSSRAFSQRGLLYSLPFLVLSTQVAIGPYKRPKMCLAVISSCDNGCIFNASRILLFFISIINLFNYSDLI